MMRTPLNGIPLRVVASQAVVFWLFFGSPVAAAPAKPAIAWPRCAADTRPRQFPEGNPQASWCETKDHLMDGGFVSLHDNGEIAVKGQYEGGYESGHWSFWFRNGEPAVEIDFDRGKPSAWPLLTLARARERLRCSDGRKISEELTDGGGHRLSCLASNRRPDGPWLTWDPSGKVVHWGWMLDGKRVGVWVQMNENGRKAVETHFEKEKTGAELSIETLAPGLSPIVSLGSKVQR